jgi:hypothetical protein
MTTIYLARWGLRTSKSAVGLSAALRSSALDLPGLPVIESDFVDPGSVVSLRGIPVHLEVDSNRAVAGFRLGIKALVDIRPLTIDRNGYEYRFTVGALIFKPNVLPGSSRRTPACDAGIHP